MAIALLQDPLCNGEAARHVAEAVRRGQAFDLAGAATSYAAAVQAGCAAARSPLIYLRGLLAARAANEQFGSAASVAPVKQAITELEKDAAAYPAVRAMQTVLRAALPAAQHERAEMGLFIEEMLRMESIQLEAQQPPLPVLSAHEAAGQFWLQLHLYEEARRAFERAAQRIGPTPHVMLGAARAAAGLKQLPAACEQYRRLVTWWKDRPGSPPEISEARTFIKQPSCAAPSPPPVRR
ncbi:MAG TPA: hypothetical protein VM819_11735 [Vicinamibacterales bacterium]|nr:hypothetical protein [Vicinamibacterales bacterium]